MLRKITTYEGYFERFIATLSPKKAYYADKRS